MNSHSGEQTGIVDESDSPSKQEANTTTLLCFHFSNVFLHRLEADLALAEVALSWIATKVVSTN